MMRRRAIALFLAFGLAAPALAQKGGDSGLLLPGANGKAPINIDADKLVYDDKAQTATYSGNVVVVQGNAKLTCSSMTIHFEKGASAADGAAKPSDAGAAPGPDAAPGAMGSASITRLEAIGPVTVISKTQVATGDTATYDETQRKVWLNGHVTLSDGANVTKGDKLVYDLATGRATVDTAAAGGRVHGLFVPGSTGDPTASDAANPKK